MAITKPHNLIRIFIIPYDKRKTMKQLQKGFEVLFKVEEFLRTLVMLPQYIDFLKCQIDEDVSVTRDVEAMYKLGTNIVDMVKDSKD